MPNQDDTQREHLLHNGRYSNRIWFIYNEDENTFSWKPEVWKTEDDHINEPGNKDDEAEDEDQPPTDNADSTNQTVDEEQSTAENPIERMDIDSHAERDASRLEDSTAKVDSAQPTVATSSTAQPDQVCKESITY